MTFSIILAFGVIPAGSLFPNAAESFNKNISGVGELRYDLAIETVCCHSIVVMN
jgi:hypothetical protein